jgi:hypothetical protein
MQGVTILYVKGAVIRHQQRWPSEQTIQGVGPPSLEDDENQARGLRIVSVLNELAEQSAPTATSLYLSARSIWIALDLVERAPNDARVGSAINPVW